MPVISDMLDFSPVSFVGSPRGIVFLSDADVLVRKFSLELFVEGGF